MRAALDRASKKIEGAFPDLPRVEASIRQALGVAYQNLGHYDQADPHLEAALENFGLARGENHESTAIAMGEYAANLAHHVSPSSLRETKAQLYADLHDDVGTSVARSVELIERMAAEPDFVEGATALNDKRTPDF